MARDACDAVANGLSSAIELICVLGQKYVRVILYASSMSICMSVFLS